MVFGFPPKLSRNFPAFDTSPKSSYMLAFQAIKTLKWAIGEINESGFSAYTKLSLMSWGEKINIKVIDGSIIFHSECTGMQFTDLGKNEQNYKAFYEAFQAQAKYNYFTEGELETAYTELQNTFIRDEQQLSSQHLPPKFSNFLSYFIPAKGYFITPILLNMNLIIFSLMAISGISIFSPKIDQLLQWGANYRPLTVNNGWWRLIANYFLHIDLLHLLFNMYALAFIGQLLEPRIGKMRFLTAYLLAGLLGSVASTYWNYLTVSAGASGAIFGLYGVYIALLSTGLTETSARKPLLTSTLLFVGFNVLFGFVGEGIDNAAHLGGLFGGLMIGLAFYPSLKSPEWVRLKNNTVTFLVIGGISLSSFVIGNLPNNYSTYEKILNKFSSFEAMAMEVFYLPANTPTKDLIYEIEHRSLYYWEKCHQLIQKMDKMDIPYSSKQKNKLLLDYCNLRIACFKNMKQALSENTDKYDQKIEEYNMEIEKILEQLSY